MISDAPPVPVEVRLERMRMALAEVGIDGSVLYEFGDNLIADGGRIDADSFWRSGMIAGGSTYIMCHECWRADGCMPGRRSESCVAPVGVYDCGRSDR